MNIADIRAIEIDRNIYGRIFNVGRLKIGTAAHSGEEVHIEYVYDPSLIRNVILARKNIQVTVLRRTSE